MSPLVRSLNWSTLPLTALGSLASAKLELGGSQTQRLEPRFSNKAVLLSLGILFSLTQLTSPLTSSSGGGHGSAPPPRPGAFKAIGAMAAAGSEEKGNAPRYLEGYTLLLPEYSPVYLPSSPHKLANARAENFADYADWDWIEGKQTDYLFYKAITELRFDLDEMGVTCFGHMDAVGRYSYERISGNQILITIENINYHDDESVLASKEFEEEYILLEFTTKHSGKAVWGDGTKFGLLDFSLERSGSEESSDDYPEEEPDDEPRGEGIDAFCKVAQKTGSLWAWNKLKEYHATHPQELSEKQRELLSLGFYYMKNFNKPPFQYYATQLRRLLPEILTGGSLDTADRLGHTSLHYAAGMGSKKLCTWLIDNGADINAKNNLGETPLDLLGENQSGLDDWMIERGAKRSKMIRTTQVIYDQNVTFPLRVYYRYREAQNGSLKAWTTLKKYYDTQPQYMTEAQRELFPLAFYYTRSFKGESSRFYAAQLLRMLPSILAGDALDQADWRGNTALHYAAGIGGKGVCLWLMKNGANINAKNKRGETPLDLLGKNKSGLDQEMISRGGKRTRPIRDTATIFRDNIAK